MPRRLHGLRSWRKRARLQLIHHPLCAMCLERGVITPATVADHIVAHHNDPNLFYRGALQSLCTPCHSGRKQSLEARERLIEERGYSLDIGSDGYPLDPRHPVYRQ